MRLALCGREELRPVDRVGAVSLQGDLLEVVGDERRVSIGESISSFPDRAGGHSGP